VASIDNTRSPMQVLSEKNSSAIIETGLNMEKNTSF
jgi:hypothetical protein